MYKYNQSFGRPHTGLSNPSYYGLTYEEVVVLVETGKWDKYRRNFRARIRRCNKIKAKNWVCPKCYVQKLDESAWDVKGLKCKSCLPSNKKPKALNCHFCRLLVLKPIELCKRPSCSSCIKKFEEYMKQLEISNEVTDSGCIK
jgi:hypothetical protein